MSAEEFYTIGEISRICNISAKTLRFYDNMDLLKPEIKNPNTLYRYYTKEQMFSVFTIKKLQLLGCSLKEIKTLLDRCSSDLYISELSTKLKEISNKITTLQKIYAEGLFLINKLKMKKSNTEYLGAETLSLSQSLEPVPHMNQKEIKIETIKTVDVIYTVEKMYNYNNIDISINRWFEIYKITEDHNLTVTGSIILTYHTENPMEQFFKSTCDLEVMLPVDRDGQDVNGFKTFGGFIAAVAVHIGSYETISSTHLRLLKWIDENGFIVTGNIFEEYLFSPIDLKTEYEYITRVIAPVAPKTKPTPQTV